VPKVPGNIFFPGFLLQGRQAAFLADIKLLFKMAAQQFFESLLPHGLPIKTDKLAFDCFRDTWAKLRFSLVHLAPSKDENVQEYYQVWYETFFSVWKEYALVFDPKAKPLWSAILTFGVYTTFMTCKHDSRPKVEIDSTHYDILFTQKSSDFFDQIPYSAKVLSSLRQCDAFTFSFSLGCKTI
jgi:hypothetical protein